MPGFTLKALAELEPEGLGPESSRWQQLKSSQTRVAILEAALECLAAHGYTQTSTQRIASTARISRGAMLYHYATRQALIAATIEYAFYKRLETFARRIQSLTATQRSEENLGVEIVWEIYRTKEYLACQELSMAARTDAELKSIYLPRARKFDRIQRREVAKLFPEWAGEREAMLAAQDFVAATVEGIATHADIWGEKRVRQQLTLLENALLKMRRGAEPPPRKPKKT